MQKNVTGQYWWVRAFDRTDGTPVTGDSANITADLSIDGAAANPVDDTNPTEFQDGLYRFDITQAESNGDQIIISPSSTTGDVQVLGKPEVYDTTAINSNLLNIESDGDLTKVNTLDGQTPQTGDSFTRIGVNGAGLSNINLPNQTMDITGSLSGSVGSVTASVTVGTNNDKSGYNLAADQSGVTIGTANTVTDGAKSATALTDATWTDAKAAFIDAAISSRAVAGDEMNLADDAITSDKYDETSSFPVTLADNGSTAIGREGLDGTSNTLATLSTQIGGISGGGSALSTDADSYTPVTATQTTGTFADTSNIDGVYHGVTNIAGTLDYYYTMNIGTTSSPVQVSVNGRLDEGSPPSGNDVVDIIAYNNDTMAFEVVRGLAFLGINGSTGVNDTTEQATLFPKHVDTNGDVKVGIAGTSLEVGTEMLIDQITVDYAPVGSPTGFDNGGVWIDTINGLPGTSSPVGTSAYKSNNLPEAIVIAAAQGGSGLNKLIFAQGSSVQFVQSMNNYELTGSLDWSVDLNNQQVDNSTIFGANISGVATGNGGSLLITDSQLGTVTLPDCSMVHCAIGDKITYGEGGDYIFEDCFSVVAGTGTPCLDHDVAVIAHQTSLRHHSGGIEIENMKSVDTMSIEGDGQIIINANCTGGLIVYRGNFDFEDNSGGAVTIVNTAGFNAANIREFLGLASANLDTQLGDIPTVAEFEARTILSADYFDPAVDDVAQVTLVVTTTTNTDMRGTDNAALATVCTETRLAELDAANLPLTTDTIALDVAGLDGDAMRGTDNANTVVPMTAALSQTEHDATQSAIGGLNNISATDIVSNGAITTLLGAVANVDLVDVTTTNSDMRGTDSANTVVPLAAAVDQANSDQTQTDIAELPTASEIDTELTANHDAGSWSPGGGVSINILPLQATTLKGGRQESIRLSAYQHAEFNEVFFGVTDQENNAVDLSAIPLTWIAWDTDDTGTILMELSTAAGTITVTGDDDNTVNLLADSDDTATAYNSLRWRLIGTSNDVQYANGYIDINEAANPV